MSPEASAGATAPRPRMGNWTGGFGPILRREIKAYLASPLFYVLVGIVLLASGVMFVSLVYQFALFSSPAGRSQMPEGLTLNSTQFILTNSFYMTHFLFLFTLPILSMRLIAEERKSGTLELLVTNPVRDWGLLLGKYFAAQAVVALILLLTLAYPVSVQLLGGQPEWSVVVSCLVGLALIASAYLSFGLFASSITESQVVAAVLSYVGLFLFFIGGNLLSNAGSDRVRAIASGLAIEPHFTPFTTGRLGLIDVVYFILFSLFFLFLSAQVLGMRRWKV